VGNRIVLLFNRFDASADVREGVALETTAK
jgi:hypothetical protein